MSLAVISVAALALAIIVSCVTTLNVGVLAVALAWVIGVYIGGMPVNTVMGGFPTQLFLTLTGMTLLFSHRAVQRHARPAGAPRRPDVPRQPGAIPMMFFLLAAVARLDRARQHRHGGPLAPMAMATAARVRIPLFLMAIMVGNGANAGSLSPFAPTGIIVNGLMARNGMPGYEVPTYLYNLRRTRRGRLRRLLPVRRAEAVRAGDAAAGDTDAPAVEAGPFEARHWLTLGRHRHAILGVIVLRRERRHGRLPRLGGARR